MNTERWHQMSLCEQMGNIGSEFSRTLSRKEKDDKKSEQISFDRLLELIDLTISDKRWKNRASEILRLREIICDFFVGKNTYNTSPKVLKEYFLNFSIRALKDKKYVKSE